VNQWNVKVTHTRLNKSSVLTRTVFEFLFYVNEEPRQP